MDASIQKYKAFLTTAEVGSFSKAAEILNYSQSGISRMIKDIEDELELTLLERGKKGIKLTSDGTRLLPYARNLIREYDNLSHAVSGLSNLKHGLIKIGVCYTFSREYLSRAMSNYISEYPGIDFETYYGNYNEIEEMVRTGQVDIGFTKLPAAGEFESIFLTQEKLVAVLPKKYKEEKYPVVSFSGEDFLLYSSGNSSDSLELLERCNVAVNVKLKTSDTGLILSMVKSKSGVSILPESLANGAHTAPLDVPAFIDMGVIFRSRHNLSVAVKKLLEEI